MCGFSQSTLVTFPFRTTFLLLSNSAEKEWCASIGTAAESIPIANTASLAFIRNLPELFSQTLLLLSVRIGRSGKHGASIGELHRTRIAGFRSVLGERSIDAD